MISTRGIVVSALVAVYLGAVGGCGSGGGSSDGTTYWREPDSNIGDRYLSLTIRDDQAAGYANYGGEALGEDETWKHFEGLRSADDAYEVTAYNGMTVAIAGDEMTATTSDGSTLHWEKITASEFADAGGPVD